MKARVQKLLKRAGVYQRLKTSWMYDAYWSVADRSVTNRRKIEIRFYRGLLGGMRDNCLIFDVGANHGTKSDVFLRLGARVVAVEPDRTNQQILKEKFLTYRLSAKPLVIVGKALSDKDAVETMWIDQPGSAKNTLSQKWVKTLREDESWFGYRHDFGERVTVETTTLDALIGAHGMPFFIKIDVEGHEAHVLRGLHHAVPYLSFEVNLPEFASEGQECVALLDRLASNGRFNYATGQYEKGMALGQWLSASDFSRALANCAERSIEVFWKASPRKTA
jgi:FkbM family methyltransferase